MDQPEKKARKKASQSPSSLTMKHFRKRGCLCQIVEKRVNVPGKGSFLKDLFGCIDIICIAGVDTIGIQATDYTSHSKRVKKAMYIPELKPWLMDGSNRKFLVLGWRKDARTNRWVARATKINLLAGQLVAVPFQLA